MLSDTEISNARRRKILAVAAGSALLGMGVSSPRPVRAQTDFPVKPIVLIAPFPAGGPNDTVARVVGQQLSLLLKQPVNVDNRSGAAGHLGTSVFLNAPADGYTLLVGAAYLVVSPHLYKNVKYDATRDLIPLASPVDSMLVVVSHPASPDLKTLIARAKTTGTPIRMASPGTGTLSHLGGELLKLVSGAPFILVPYRGTAAAQSDVIGQNVDLMIDGVSSALPLIRAGRMKALAIPDEARNPLLPDVATVAELGYPGVVVRAWNAFFAPAGAPREVVERLSADLSSILARPDIAQELRSRGLEPTTLSPARFRERIAAESALWARVIREAGVTVD